MSSGSILLQQLRGRRGRQSSKSSSSRSCVQNTNKSSSDGNENTDITSCDGAKNATAVTLTNPSEVAISQRTISAFNTTRKKVIEVCLGPDCAVAGGGAALLEIEDLILQQCPNKKNDDTIIVQAGGCRDQCSEGPNVRILSCNGDSGSSRVDVDFHKVNSPEACRRVVDSLCLREASPTIFNELHAAAHSTFTTSAAKSNKYDDSSDTSSSDNVVARLLSRKEDARRWKAHRERAAKERRLQSISRNQGT